MLDVSESVEPARGERLHHRPDFSRFGKLAYILTHQLVAQLLRHVGKLVPCHLALNWSETIDKPLADRVLVHAGPAFS